MKYKVMEICWLGCGDFVSTPIIIEASSSEEAKDKFIGTDWVCPICGGATTLSSIKQEEK